ncbi:MAG: hypothetical protein ACJAXW_004503, partial [Candidatus Azotimanducaceae bacterium]
ALTRHPKFQLKALPGVRQLVWYAVPEKVIEALEPYMPA